MNRWDCPEESRDAPRTQGGKTVWPETKVKNTTEIVLTDSEKNDSSDQAVDTRRLACYIEGHMLASMACIRNEKWVQLIPIWKHRPFPTFIYSFGYKTDAPKQ